jgi:membrane protease YdiL (CAAX protease family)
MRFYSPKSDQQNTFGTYVLILALVIFAFMVGQTISEKLANHFGGFSLYHLHDGVNRNLILLFSVLPFSFALATLLLSVKFLLKRPILSVFTARESFSWRRLFFSTFLWLAVLLLFLTVASFSGSPIEFALDWKNFLPLLLIALILLPLQTLAEDLFFRAVLYQGMSKLRIHPIISVLVIAVLFGLAHSANPEVDILGFGVIIYYIATGLFLGLITHFDEGIELGMGYHFANNFFGLTILTTNWQSFQTDALFIDKSPPEFGFSSILVIAVLQPALFYLFSRIYKWRKEM